MFKMAALIEGILMLIFMSLFLAYVGYMSTLSNAFEEKYLNAARFMKLLFFLAKLGFVH